MRVKIDNELHKQNRTRYWLAKELECNYQSLSKLCNNETTAISFDLLQRICFALNCSPNDILDIND